MHLLVISAMGQCTLFTFRMLLAAAFLQHFARWDEELKQHWDKTKLSHIMILHLVDWSVAGTVHIALCTGWPGGYLNASRIPLLHDWAS